MIRLGVVGCGDVAFRTYFPGLKPLLDNNDIQVAVCFDPIAERAERAAALFPGAKAATSLDEVVNFPDLDAALNLTPAPFHRDTTAALLNGNLHVFSEKPLAATVEQGQELIAQADSVGKTLMCAPAILVTNRFRWLTGLIRDGEIGQPKLALGQIAGMGPAAWRDYTGDPRVFYGPGVGPMIDTGVYILHAITGLLGPAKRVQAMGGIAIPKRKILIDRFHGEEITVTTNDQMLIQLDFGDTTFGQVVSSFAVPGSRVPAFEVHGTGGSVSINMGAWYNTNGGTDILKLDPSTGGGSGWENRTPPSPSPYGDIVSAGVPHFVAVLRGDEQPVLTAEHALHVLEIMLMAMESAAAGTSLDLTTTF
jgi:predicted dehydrogenase